MRNKQLDYELKFYNRQYNSDIVVQALELSVEELDGSIIKCLLNFRFSFELYQTIDTQGLFNLLPEVRGKIFGGQLQPGVDVEIEAKLDPILIFPLSLQVNSIEELAEHLRHISQTQAQDVLLDTESWFALYVKQLVALPPEIGEGQLKVGYSTTWAVSD